MGEVLLHAHMRWHWAAASAGRAEFRRVARSLTPAKGRDTVRELAREIDVDRQSLKGLMDAVGARPSRLASVMARLASAATRLVPVGRGVDRSARTDVRELEALRATISMKAACWELLLVLSDTDRRLDRARLQDLLQRAEDQIGRLRELHLRLALQHFTR